MPDEAQKSSIHSRFRVPDISMFKEKNPYIGSENTFNYRISPADEKLRAEIWYGMKCYESSEMVSTQEAELDENGLGALIVFLNDEFTKYTKLVDDGEVQGRRTYSPSANF